MSEGWAELLRGVDEVEAPSDLRARIEQRRGSSRRPLRASAPRRRAVAGRLLAGVGVAGVLIVMAIAAHSREHQKQPPEAGDGVWARYDHLWSRLPSPPKARTGVALAWTGSELVSLGGAVPGGGPPARDGYAFHPRTGTWSRIPPAPGPGRINAYAVWTGNEVLLIGGSGNKHEQPRDVALNTTSNAWREIPTAPIRLPADAVKVWTGAALIVWGGGRSDDSANPAGAVYVPATNHWHRIADAPIRINTASGVWTGTQMIVIGSMLNHRNEAATPTAIGASYDPRSNSWRKLPSTRLSPQATSAGWVGSRLVAWDYAGETQDYSPAADRWTAPRSNPLGAAECNPQSVVTIAQTMFAWFCGRAASVTAGPRTTSWTPIFGGVTEPTIRLAGETTPLYQTASLAPAGSRIAIAATGLVNEDGTPCFGCDGAPVSYWAYRVPRVSLDQP